MDTANAITCSKCGSPQVSATARGFGLGGAVVGSLLLGPIGLLGGTLGSRKILVACLACGYQWDPRVKQERFDPLRRSRSVRLKILGALVVSGFIAASIAAPSAIVWWITIALALTLFGCSRIYSAESTPAFVARHADRFARLTRRGYAALRQAHPSTIAVGLGLAGIFGLGALFGVPAIFMGRNVLQAASNEPRHLKHASMAKTAIVLGWISVFETAMVVAMLGTRGWATVIPGVLLPLIGLSLLALSTTKNLPAAIATVPRTLRRAPLAVGLSLGGILLGSTFGFIVANQTAHLSALACISAQANYSATVSQGNLVAISGAINTVERVCKPGQAELEVMRSGLATKEADARKEQAEAERARRAKLVTEREKNAVDTFPKERKEIAATIAGAQVNAVQGKVATAGEQLDAARRRLDAFNGTSIAQSKGFTDLASQITAKKKAVQPQIDRLQETRRKTKAAAEARTSEAPAPSDDLSFVISKYGKPDVDDSTEHDNPRPLIVTRTLIYKKEHVQVTYVVDAPVDEQPPYDKWTFLGFQDDRDNHVLHASEAAERLKRRMKR